MDISKRINFKFTAFVASLLISSAITPVYASDYMLPQGESVVAGSVSFDRDGANNLGIHQNSDRVIINWDSFNVGRNATIEFFQPSSNALAVNRIVGTGVDPTEILGSLHANGRIIVLDPNGIIFGADSVVDVGGIIASTGDIDNGAFMAGADVLDILNAHSGAIVNNGTITIADAGLVAFVAPHIQNNGVIYARAGNVVLGAAVNSTLDLGKYSISIF